MQAQGGGPRLVHGDQDPGRVSPHLTLLGSPDGPLALRFSGPAASSSTHFLSTQHTWPDPSAPPKGLRVTKANHSSCPLRTKQDS